VLRTGGQAAYGFHETLTTPVTLRLLDGDTELGTLTIATTRGHVRELAFELPPHALHDAHARLHTEASGPYRAFHWFVLQPD